ncbi:unnamed protein product [Tuber melanosporum]|uniref:ubiquitinyl hydrolase 1 n=1 Tax=Tuber melanosporum (strain Mel28) TaxID=656061 RepID=D5G541_TUBMM|nr:uncharacterized protein GSTUM_00000242001 [Tuber melanosporum]CAZ79626.1 unnamed protein product [Tuber melanosporum]
MASSSNIGGSTRVKSNISPCAAPEIRGIVEQKENWGGWATTLNDATIFEYIMRQVGCESVAVRELYSMEEDYLREVKSCYGIIFLMPYNEHYETQAGEELKDLPDGMWYSNQIADNACASYALLNILMNLNNVPLGTQLEGFREFTLGLLPPHRGQAVDGFKSIKNAHNSFCFRYEIEEADLILYEEAVRDSDPKSELKSKENHGGKKYKTEEAEVARGHTDQIDGPHHYIAYVQVGGCLWELDGLKQTPFKVGDCNNENFAVCVGSRMRELTARCSDLSIDFGIFALEPAKAPQLDKQHQANAREIGAIERKLQEIDPHSSLRKEDLLSGLLILPPSDTDDFGHHNGMMTEQLVELRTDLIQKQKAIEMEKDNLFNEESRKALELARNRHDYEPFILTMATMVWAQQQAEAKTIKPKKKGRKGR